MRVARARAMEADAPKTARSAGEGAGADSATRVRDSARSGSPKKSSLVDLIKKELKKGLKILYCKKKIDI